MKLKKKKSAVPLSALGRGKERRRGPGLQKDSGLGEWAAWWQRKREGRRLCLPAQEPTPQPQAGHFLASLEQEEALEVCRKTGSDCRKWVPLFSPSPAWPLLGIAPSLGQPSLGRIELVPIVRARLGLDLAPSGHADLRYMTMKLTFLETE